MLARQEANGLERNRARGGREVEGRVDTLSPPRSHDHGEGGDGAAGEDPSTGPHVSGRSRQNKLVHLPGDAGLIGRLVSVRIEHAGPYALRGVIVGE
jgi:hypothetical protein